MPPSHRMKSASAVLNTPTMNTNTTDTNTNNKDQGYFARALEQAKQARDEITSREDAYRRIVITPQDEIILKKCFNYSMAGFFGGAILAAYGGKKYIENSNAWIYRGGIARFFFLTGTALAGSFVGNLIPQLICTRQLSSPDVYRAYVLREQDKLQRAGEVFIKK